MCVYVVFITRQRFPYVKVKETKTSRGAHRTNAKHTRGHLRPRGRGLRSRWCLFVVLLKHKYGTDVKLTRPFCFFF